MSANARHCPNEIFESLVMDQSSNAKDDPWSILCPNPLHLFQVAVVKMIYRNSEGDHPAPRTEFWKHIRSVDVVWAGYDNCGGLIKRVAQNRPEYDAELLLPDNIAVIGEDQLPRVAARQIRQDGRRIRPM